MLKPQDFSLKAFLILMKKRSNFFFFFFFLALALAWPAVVQLLVFIYSGIQFVCLFVLRV